MLPIENVNKFETPSSKQSMLPKSNSMQNQKHIQIFCKDLSKINIPDECGWTPLYRTVIAGDIFSTTLLLNNGADPNIQCTMGETPLFQAVDMEKIEHVKLLLKNGANPNLTNEDGLAPLHIAVIKQNISIVKILLKYGADPNLKSKLYQQTPLHLAIKNNADPMILLLLVQFNGSLINEDKFKKKPIDYTNSKEMQSTIEKLKFGQENSEKNEKEKEIHKFQTPRKNFGWTPSNIYSNTIRSKSHQKELLIEGNNAILQNPGNLKYTIISGKNSVTSNIKNSTIKETVKKDLFNSSGKIINKDNNVKEDKENIDILNIEEKDLNKKMNSLKFLEDKENINPNNIINFTIHKTKTGNFGTIQEENSLVESRKNNNSLKPNITKKNSNDSNSSENDKSNQKKEISFSFSTNTFNNKIEANLSQSLKQEAEDNKERKEKKDKNENVKNKGKNENKENDENNENININIKSIKKSININKENVNINNNGSDNNSNEDEKDNINMSNTNKKKIIIKSYYNKEKKGNINDETNFQKEKKNDDYLYEKIIEKTITQIEIYDDNYINKEEDKDITKNTETYYYNETVNNTVKKNLNEEDSKTKTPNKSLYNKPIIKKKYSFKKANKIVNMRPSLEVNLNKSNNSLLDNSFPKRSTFTGHVKHYLNKNMSFQKQKLATTRETTSDNIKNIKTKSLKNNSMSRASSTTMGVSGIELNQNKNQNSLWKFLNDIITNDKSIYQSITNNINTDRENFNEINYKFPIYDWLKEINLHCYYSLFKEKGILGMDKVINNLKTGKFNITKNDIQKIGIFIPGHIYRIITKLEIDSCKINEKISNFLIKNKKRLSGNINIVNNSNHYCCGCCSTSEQIHNFIKTKRMFNLEQWLNKIKMMKYKDNFIENGFELFEYFILQMFSTFPIDDFILKEELKIDNNKDRDIILLRLNKDVKYIIQKTEDNIFCYNNSYEIGEQRNFEEKNVYEFDSFQEEKNSECIII